MTGSVLTIPTDVSSGDCVRPAFAQIEERFGRVDILVNSAGAARLRAIEETADEDIHTCIGTNPQGPIHTVRSAAPLLPARAEAGDSVHVCRARPVHAPDLDTP